MDGLMDGWMDGWMDGLDSVRREAWACGNMVESAGDGTGGCGWVGDTLERGTKTTT